MVKIWKSSRTVIFNEEGKTAIIEVKDGEYYKIPGGRIEGNETKREAAHREAREESGCDIEIISKIGDYEFTSLDKRIHRATCYLARKIKDNKSLNFDDWEKSNKFKFMWIDFEKAINLFENSKTDDDFGKKINKRDLNFLKAGWEKYTGVKKKKVI